MIDWRPLAATRKPFFEILAHRSRCVGRQPFGGSWRLAAAVRLFTPERHSSFVRPVHSLTE